MQSVRFSFDPSLAPEVVEERLARLLVPGALFDPRLERRLTRLDRAFHYYATGITHGLWSPGLIVSNEMRSVAELQFPLKDILAAFSRVVSLAVKVPPVVGASMMHNATSWPDALHQLQSLVKRPNPAELLRHLLVDEKLRRLFLFANFLPAHYGGGFNRYPLQMDFLVDWLVKNRRIFNGKVYCLDAACGCGEGTYDLATVLIKAGFTADQFYLCGSTVEPFELFAAAHVFFPHDLKRQAAYRRQIAPLHAREALRRVVFSQEDLLEKPARGGEFHIIVCNGILGGPFLHERRKLEQAVAGLTMRLCRRGLLLAADRFHGGWKKQMPVALMAEAFRKAGLEVIAVADGLAGVKTG